MTEIASDCSHKYRFMSGIVLLLLTVACQQAITRTGGSEVAASTDKKPNIIFILADDLGFGHLGSYGQTVLQTPELDKLAEDGLRFTQAYAGSTVCAPSRSVLMTGMHTGHTTVRANFAADGTRIPLKDSDVTLAEVLKGAGYVTGMVGKWGLGEPGTSGLPNQQGFDYWFGFLNQHQAHSYYPSYLWRDDRIVYFNKNENGQRNTYIHDVFVDEALGFIRRNRDKPFFLYFPLTLPHTELAAPEAMVEPYRRRFEEVPLEGIRGRPPVREPKAVYAGMIATMDRDVGRIRALLKELDIEDNTLLVFTSDNGPATEEGADARSFAGSGILRGIKRDLYEGGIRVPFIASWPAYIEPGQVDRSSQITFWDVLPTFAELAAVAPPDGIDGRSFLSTLFGKPPSTEPRFLYWEFLHEAEGRLVQAVRYGDWKAVRQAPDQPLELYDLSSDPAESTDIAAEHPVLIAKIKDYLATARHEIP